MKGFVFCLFLLLFSIQNQAMHPPPQSDVTYTITDDHNQSCEFVVSNMDVTETQSISTGVVYYNDVGNTLTNYNIIYITSFKDLFINAIPDIDIGYLNKQINSNSNSMSPSNQNNCFLIRPGWSC